MKKQKHVFFTKLRQAWRLYARFFMPAAVMSGAFFIVAGVLFAATWTPPTEDPPDGNAPGYIFNFEGAAGSQALGSFNITGNGTMGSLTVSGASATVNGQAVCLADGTNCSPDTGYWTQSGTSLYPTNTAWNLGIGLSSLAGSKLQIVNNVGSGNIDQYNEYQILLFNGGTAAGSYGLGIQGSTMVFNSGANYKFFRGGSVVDLSLISGNLGLRETAPGYPIHVDDDSNTAIINIDNDGAYVYTGVRIERDSNQERWFLGVNNVDNKLRIRRDGTTDVMVIDADNEVGIGTLNPILPLDVDRGQIRLGLTAGGPPAVTDNALYNVAGDLYWDGTKLNATGIGGSGALNYVPKWTPNGSSLGNSTIYDDGTAVGIGTTDAYDELGKLRISSGLPKTSSVNASIAYFGSNESSPSTPFGLRVRITGSAVPKDRRVDVSTFELGSPVAGNLILQGQTTGKLGIGGPKPNEFVEINDTSMSGTTRLRVTDVDTNPEIQLQYGPNTNNDHWSFFTTSDGDRMLVWGGGANRMSIMNNGNVGINTYTPSSALDVTGNAEISGNLGINTATPATRLHVVGSAVIDNGLKAIPATGPIGGKGDRLILSPGAGYPYSIGVGQAPASLWYSVPGAAAHEWYIGGSRVLTMTQDHLSVYPALVIWPDTPAPPAPVNGMIYYESTTNKFRCYQNSAWVDCIASGGDNLGNHIATQNLNMNNFEIDNVKYLDIQALTGNGIRFWSSDAYAINMGSGAEFQYGPVTGYSIKSNMNNDSTRGWTWGVDGQIPKAAINTQGNMRLSGEMRASWVHSTAAGNNTFTGSVGIGTTNPSQKLEVNGNTFINGVLRVGANNSSGITGDVVARRSATTGAYYFGDFASNYLYFDGTNYRFGASGPFINPSGSVGIGTATPSAKLEIAGTVKIADGSQGLNKVLTSDAAGLASWKPVSGGDNLGNHIATQNLNMNNFEIDNVKYLDIQALTGNGIRFWSSDAYAINMGSGAEFQYGPVTGYSIKSNMNNDSTRGWTWGVDNTAPVAAINTQGNMRLSGEMRASWVHSTAAGNNTFAGNVSIGTTVAPGATLEVAGTVKITGGTPGAGKVLTSDAAGLASWQPPSGGVTGGTANYVAKWTGLTALTSSQIFDNGTNVGIGTAAPGYKLDVAGNVNVRTNAVAFGGSVSTDSTAGLYWHTVGSGNDYSIYRTGGAWTAPYQQIKIDWPTGIVMDPGTGYGKSYVDIQGNGLRVTSGTVGIGTAAPATTLEVDDTSAAAATVRITDTAQNPGIQLKYGSDTNNYWAFYASQPSGNLNIWGSDSLGVGYNRFTIIRNGYVGIGTTAPTANLEISRTASGAGSGIKLVQEHFSGDAAMTFVTTGGNVFALGIDRDDGNKFKITQGGALGGTGDRLVIDSITNVVTIGAPSGAKVDINGRLKLLPSAAPASPANGMMYYDTTSNKFKCYENGAWKDCVGPGSGFQGQLAKWSNSTTLGTSVITDDGTNIGIGTSPSYKLHVAGDIAYTGNLWDVSDIRLKKAVTPLGSTLEKIKNLDGVTFNWNSEQFPEMNFSNERQIGLIAQQVEKEYPELVSTGENGMKSVAYDKMVVVLLEAVKEQQAEIEQLKALIGATDEADRGTEDRAAVQARLAGLRAEAAKEPLQRPTKPAAEATAPSAETAGLEPGVVPSDAQQVVPAAQDQAQPAAAAAEPEVKKLNWWQRFTGWFADLF